MLHEHKARKYDRLPFSIHLHPGVFIICQSNPLFSFFLFCVSYIKSNDLTRLVIAKLICGLSLCRIKALLSFHPCQDNSSCQTLIRFVSTAPAQQLLTFEIHFIIKATRETE